MKDFNSLSGPWLGFSVQDGLRISERISLRISDGKIQGSGTDMDGDFELSGFFENRSQRLMLTRRYTRTTEPSQDGVGIPYDYEGSWDGALAFGRWHPRMNPFYGGEFEMWPDLGEDSIQQSLIQEQKEPTLVRSRQILPYKYLGTWVFDDSQVGLLLGPFVVGANTRLPLLPKRKSLGIGCVG